MSPRVGALLYSVCCAIVGPGLDIILEPHETAAALLILEHAAGMVNMGYREENQVVLPDNTTVGGRLLNYTAQAGSSVIVPQGQLTRPVILHSVSLMAGLLQDLTDCSLCRPCPLCVQPQLLQ